jgi:predicted GIY-YIG superfamily endonuclease
MKVYIIYSLKGGRFYVGQTKDIDRRIEEHNRRQVASTKPVTSFDPKAGIS